MSLQLREIGFRKRLGKKDKIESNRKIFLLDGLNVEVANGELLRLMGKSGIGKSTLVALLAGYLDTSVFEFWGSVFLNGQEITYFPISKRRVGVLFQDHILFPHMSVKKNLLFAIHARRNERQSEKKRDKQLTEEIEYYLERIHMQGFLNRDPATLSGGERARVSLLQTILARPEFVLLDEPFSRLDVSLREKIRHFFFSELKKANIPVVLVTHDHHDKPDRKLMKMQTLKLENFSFKIG